MKSIRFKLWAGMMTLVLVVLVLLWLFQIVFLENFYTDTRISDVKKEAANLIKLLDNEESREFEDKMEAFAFNNNMSIEIVDLRGKSIYLKDYSNQMPMMMMKNTSRVEVYESVLAGKEAIIPVIHPKFGNKFMMIGLPITSSGNLSGVFILNMPLAPVEDTASILKRQLFYITFILLAASLVISFLLSRSFTQPILEIKEASEKMASGDFTKRVNSRRSDEIGKLADTINNLGRQLSKMEQLRKDFIANVSHELRTPLTLIRGYAETLRDVTGNDSEKREKQLGIIINETKRLGGIVDDILNLSQIQSGYFKLEKSQFPIQDMLNSVLSRYDVLSEKTGVKIQLLRSSNAILEADKTRMEQVLYNLINNAFNHTPSGGTITMKAIDNSETVRVEISDTGSGIPKEDIPHIWDRYYKGEKTGDKKSEGTGLGLSIVKGVLEAHKATFGVESQKNVKTTFWFELEKI